MSELVALKGLIADSLIVSTNVDPSVIGPETLRFSTTEQMRKVLAEQFALFAKHYTSVDSRVTRLIEIESNRLIMAEAAQEMVSLDVSR